MINWILNFTRKKGDIFNERQIFDDILFSSKFEFDNESTDIDIFIQVLETCNFFMNSIIQFGFEKVMIWRNNNFWTIFDKIIGCGLKPVAKACSFIMFSPVWFVRSVIMVRVVYVLCTTSVALWNIDEGRHTYSFTRLRGVLLSCTFPQPTRLVSTGCLFSTGNLFERQCFYRVDIHFFANFSDHF